MRRLRAAVHVHTSWSFDGCWSLAALARALKRRGYDAMLTAEHSQSLDETGWVDYQAECARVSAPDFLVVPGVEYRDADNVVHLPTWGDLPFLGDGLPVGDVLTQVSVAGGVAILAHPGRKGAWRRFEEEWVEHLSGIEVWNRKYDGWQPGPHGLRLSTETGLPGFASLDFHRRRQFWPVATDIFIDTERDLDPLMLVSEAIRLGRVRPAFLGGSLDRWHHGASRAALAAADRSRRSTLAAARWTMARRLRGQP